MRPLFFNFIASVSLLFHFLSKQLLNKSAFAFVRYLLKQHEPDSCRTSAHWNDNLCDYDVRKI